MRFPDIIPFETEKYIEHFSTLGDSTLFRTPLLSFKSEKHLKIENGTKTWWVDDTMRYMVTEQSSAVRWCCWVRCCWVVSCCAESVMVTTDECWLLLEAARLELKDDSHFPQFPETTSKTIKTTRTKGPQGLCSVLTCAERSLNFSPQTESIHFPLR